MIRKILC